MNLADLGHFWVGVDRKKMPYGTIATGQMFVQYFIPAQVRKPYPIVLVHGGGGQSTHFMGIGRRPGWMHFLIQEGYRVYVVDRPGFGRAPYHPDSLGPSQLQLFPAYDGFAASPAVMGTVRWPGNHVIGEDPLVDQFMANEISNASDEAYHSELCAKGGVELLDKIGPVYHARSCLRRVSGLDSGRPPAGPGKRHHGRGDQWKSVRRAVALGTNCDPADLRSASK